MSTVDTRLNRQLYPKEKLSNAVTAIRCMIDFCMDGPKTVSMLQNVQAEFETVDALTNRVIPESVVFANALKVSLIANDRPHNLGRLAENVTFLKLSEPEGSIYYSRILSSQPERISLPNFMASNGLITPSPEFKHTLLLTEQAYQTIRSEQ